MANEVALKDALHPSDNDGVEAIRHPIEPPEFEVFAQKIVENVGKVKEYVLQSYKEAGLDPLVHSQFKTWADVPSVVKGRVKYLLSLSASSAVASRRELEVWLTARIRGTIVDRRVNPLEALKELCKMKGFYSPIEIKNTHEVTVPKQISALSTDELRELAAETVKEMTINAEEVTSQSPFEED